MAKLSQLDVSDFKALQEEIRSRKQAYTSYENIAQDFMDEFYNKFKDSIILSRVFLTVPYSRLPQKNKVFVDKLADTHSIQELINDNTLILSLVGSAGIEEQWFDRRNSQDHIGIPLASADFIDRVPMMSRLLRQLGLDLNYISSDDTKLVKHTLGRMNGMFYVKDAKTEVDIKGRKIIAAQNFVDKYKVKTVMGFGGGYTGPYPFYTCIIFLNETIEPSRARLISAEMAFFKIVSMGIVKQTIFND